MDLVARKQAQSGSLSLNELAFLDLAISSLAPLALSANSHVHPLVLVVGVEVTRKGSGRDRDELRATRSGSRLSFLQRGSLDVVGQPWLGEYGRVGR